MIEAERKDYMYRLNIAMMQQLKARAALEGVTLTALLERIIAEYLEIQVNQ